MSYYLYVGCLKCDNVSFGQESIDNVHISAKFVVALKETKQTLSPSSKWLRYWANHTFLTWYGTYVYNIMHYSQ